MNTKKLIVALAAITLGGTAMAQEKGWSVTPEVGLTAVNRVNTTEAWSPGVKAGASVAYTFKPGWIALKSGLFYTNRGFSEGDQPLTLQLGEEQLGHYLMGGKCMQHFLQLPIMADFSWKLGKNVRMHFGAGVYGAVSLKNYSKWGSKAGYETILPNEETSTNSLYHQGYHDGYATPEGYETCQTNPFPDSRFDWGITTQFGIEVQNWVMNVGYELSLGDEKNRHATINDFGYGVYDSSVGANYNTLSLSIGYKFKLGK